MEQWVTAVKERIQSPIEIDIHDVFVADRRSAARPLVSAAGSYLGAEYTTMKSQPGLSPPWCRTKSIGFKATRCVADLF